MLFGFALEEYNMFSPNGGRKVNLELHRDEFELVRQVLERHLSNLRMEIAGTEKYDWRKDMQADEERLKNVLARLDEAAQAGEDVTIFVRGFVLVER